MCFGEEAGDLSSVTAASVLLYGLCVGLMLERGVWYLQLHTLTRGFPNSRRSKIQFLTLAT